MGDDRVFVIAEAGVNHDGSLERALELVTAASTTGADAVKFQSFRSEDVVRRGAAKARYQALATGTDESQLEMLQRLELSVPEQVEIRDRCRALGIEFLSTPFDPESLARLVEMNVPRLKLSSGDLTNELLLRSAAATDVPLIISTGMATLDEVEWALGVVASVWLGIQDPVEALANEMAPQRLAERVTLLHCTSEYPTQPNDVNLRAMGTLRQAFGVRVGYSDHTVGLAVPLAAVALGATVLEKHFTLDRELVGPDHAASTEPDEFRRLVEGIRTIELSLGSGRKVPTDAELLNRQTVRRSLVALCAIAVGECFTEANLGAKRPADSVPASRYSEFLGRAAQQDYEPDEPIRE